MRRSIRVAAATAILMLAFPIASVQAVPPVAVHFDIQTSVSPDGNGGPFVATGAAVDAGLICPSGDSLDVFGKVTPWRPTVALLGNNLQVQAVRLRGRVRRVPPEAAGPGRPAGRQLQLVGGRRHR